MLNLKNAKIILNRGGISRFQKISINSQLKRTFPHSIFAFSSYRKKNDKKSRNSNHYMINDPPEVEKVTTYQVDEYQVLDRYRIILPIILLPLQFHTGMCLIDYFTFGSCYPNSFRLFFKHTFLVLLFNEGINVGYSMNRQEDIAFKITAFLMRIFLLILSLVSISFLLCQPMTRILFNFCLALNAYTSFVLLENFTISIKLSKNLRNIMLACNIIIIILINIEYSKYKKSLEESGKYEEVLNIYQHCTDEEFKMVMNEHESYLDEIDIRFEKRKE